MNLLILAKRPHLVLVYKKLIIFHLVDFAVLFAYRMKVKENERINKYFDLV